MRKKLMTFVVLGAVMGLFGGNMTLAEEPPQPFPRSEMQQELTAEQKDMIASVLSQYDPENLTAEDAKAINEAFREAGIRKGPDQREAIETAGFDPREISALDPPPDRGGKMGHERPDTGASLSDEQKTAAASILAQYDPDTLTGEDAKAINEAFRKAGIRRGADQREAIESAGFDPEKIRNLAPPPHEKRHGPSFESNTPAEN